MTASLGPSEPEPSRTDAASGDVLRHDVFAFLWAAANVFHVASFPGWRWDHPLGWAYAAATTAVLLRPGSFPAFAAMVAADLAGLAVSSPKYPNHVLFSGFVNLAILAAVVRALAGRRTGDAAKSAALRGWGPAVRASVLLLYSFVVFHKLNASYFDRGVSGAARMYADVAERIPFLPGGPVFEAASVWLVLAAEAAIPALLAFPRTAAAGVLVGIAFHFLLSLHPHRGIYSFSATLLPLFWLFLPGGRIARFTAPRWTRPAAKALAAGFAVAYPVVRLTRGGGDDEAFKPELAYGMALWAVFATAVAGVFVANLGRTRGTAAAEAVSLRPGTAGFLLVPLLVALNGLCPYLGLKTESSFSMFSNLRTECGRSNHLLVPESLQCTDWLQHPVEIVACSDAQVIRQRDDRYAITYFQLRLLRTRAEGRFTVTFVRDGEVREYDSERPETHEALPPVPWIATKLCQFRPIDLDERVRFRH